MDEGTALAPPAATLRAIAREDARIASSSREPSRTIWPGPARPRHVDRTSLRPRLGRLCNVLPTPRARGAARLPSDARALFKIVRDEEESVAGGASEWHTGAVRLDPTPAPRSDREQTRDRKAPDADGPSAGQKTRAMLQPLARNGGEEEGRAHHRAASAHFDGDAG